MYIPNEFQCYHPFLTFTDLAIGRFIEPDGKIGKELTEDTERLFHLAQDAYERLKCETRDEFDEALRGWLDLIVRLRDQLVQMHRDAQLIPVNKRDEPITVDWDEIDYHVVLDLTWRMITKSPKDSGLEGLYTEAFLIQCLLDVDNALVAMWAGGGEVAAAIDAANSLYMAMV